MTCFVRFQIKPAGSWRLGSTKQLEHKSSNGSLYRTAQFTGTVSGIVDRSKRFFYQFSGEAGNSNSVSIAVLRQELGIKFSSDQSKMFRFQGTENKNFVIEFSEPGNKFRREPFFQLHLQTLLEAAVAQVFRRLKNLCADIGGGNQKKITEVIRPVVAESNPCGIQLLQ